jgi:hypothetical protein
MTLSFQTKWPERMGELAGQPNFFIQKIWQGLAIQEELYEKYDYEYLQKFGDSWDYIINDLHPKLHTIRKDSSNRWKPGMDIHFVINNRTKNRFQFAPVIPCVSIQKIEIWHESGWKHVFIDGCLIYEENEVFHTQREAMNTLALNDGFPSVEAFFAYFNQNFKGELRHWTDLKY